MFTPFQTAKSLAARVVQSAPGSAVLLCDQSLPRDEDLVVSESLVRVMAQRPAGDEAWLAVVEVLEGALPPAREELGELFGVRRTRRVPAVVRARGSELPGFTALTHDLSMEGVQLATAGPLEVGRTLELWLDLEHSTRVTARVCWTRMAAPFHAGLAFEPLSRHAHHALREYLDLVTGEGSAAVSRPDAEAPAEAGGSLQRCRHEGDTVWVELCTAAGVFAYRFDQVRSAGEPRGVNVALVDTQPQTAQDVVTRFLDARGEPVFEVVSAPPVVTLSA